MSERAVEKEVNPLQVDFEILNAQKDLLNELFSVEHKPLEYKFDRSPFTSIVDTHKSAEAENLKTENPIFTHKFEDFMLAGILSGDLGNIAVLSTEKDSYYLKTGDSFSANRTTVLFIGSDYIKVRNTNKDIFGKMKTEIKDIKLEDNLTM